MQTRENGIRNRTLKVVEIASENIQPMLAALALVLGLIALWEASHRYKGLTGDAELYAVQAMAKINRGLASDIFLQNASQDKYTIFSPMYAWWIKWLGLRFAAVSWALLFKFVLFSAAWILTLRIVPDKRIACMAVALLIVTIGTYGGFGAFQYAEDWLTARSLAEALIVSAIALHLFDFKILGVVVAVVAFFVHPIMSLPGLLILICMRTSLLVMLTGAASGVLVAVAISLWASYAPASTGLGAVIDAPWLDMLKERSVFLFPHLWGSDDWETACRPFLCLALAAATLRGARIRAICIAAAVVGATGIVIAFVAGAFGHPAIVVQAQTWRWMWVTCFLSVLLTIPAAATIYRDPRVGPVTALLLIAGWTFPPIHGIASIGLALLLWAARERIVGRPAVYLRWAAAALAIIMVAWAGSNAWNIAVSPGIESGRDALVVEQIRNILGLQIPAILLVLLFVLWVSAIRSSAILVVLVLALGICIALLTPAALNDTLRVGTAAQISAFADWRSVIPPTSNVYVAPVHYSAAFAWFTLQRPSYLTVDQSAGMVFSRPTAMEIERRSRILLPLIEPDWRLRSPGSAVSAIGSRPQVRSRPLTKERLVSICADQQLGFVVALEDVGFSHLPHTHSDDWKNWNLYSCDLVRSAAPAT